MKMLNPLRHEAFCTVAIVVAILMLCISNQAQQLVILAWALYVIPFALASVRRNGIRGLNWPSVALAAVAIWASAAGRGELLAVWCACVAIHCGVALARFVTARGGRARDQRKAQTDRGPLGKVEIVVPTNAASANAADVLSRLGL